MTLVRRAPLAHLSDKLRLELTLVTFEWLYDVIGVCPADVAPLFGAWAGAANDVEYYTPELVA